MASTAQKSLHDLGYTFLENGSLVKINEQNVLGASVGEGEVEQGHVGPARLINASVLAAVRQSLPDQAPDARCAA